MIRILHLYYDIMNLYGDNGNVRIMQRRLEDQGFNVVIENSTVYDDDIDFDADFVYMGSGYESNRNLALAHLSKFKGSLLRAVVNGVPMLFTGNSYDILGKGITTHDQKLVEGLNIFDFTFKEQIRKRYTGDVILEVPGTSTRYVGFVNRAGIPDEQNDLICNVIKVIGNVPITKDAVRKNNLLGISLLGPVLLKNPEIADMFVEIICKRKGVEFKNIEYPHSFKSHVKTLKALLDTRI